MKVRRFTQRWHRPRMSSIQVAAAEKRWNMGSFPVIGLVALVWFLVRVVPKPSRASYPCQRVAAPLASSFVWWLLGCGTLTVAFRGAREHLYRKRLLVCGLCLLAGAIGTGWAVVASTYADYPPHAANEPIGVARGLEPGRVVWSHVPAVTDWAGPGSGERWYDHVDQGRADDMVSWALRGYTGQDTDREAWDAIFRHFNSGSAGYDPGEKIFVKLNLTTANARSEMADDLYNQKESGSVTHDSIANSPQFVHALLEQLVKVVGVNKADITVGDPTGLFVNYLYRPLQADFPAVRYLDNRGTLGRMRAEFGSTPFYWSTSDAGGATQDYLPNSLAEATYVVNFAVLKTNAGSGISVNAKNHYGSLLRCPDGYLRGAANTGLPPYGINGYYDLHSRLPGACCHADETWANMGYYRPMVDLMGHDSVGGKTLLYLVDGLFGGKDWYSAPSRWAMPPFHNDWPSSLFLSMDPVAMESVAFDFIRQQWPERALMNEGVQDFLHEAALAHDPPSGTFYDPERDGTRMASLGAHEHWNNPVDKQYSRNLGSGAGIELLLLTGDPQRRAFLPVQLWSR
jgi:hypothetical protein